MKQGVALLALGGSIAEAHYGQRVWIDVDAGGTIVTKHGPPGGLSNYTAGQFSPSRVFTRDMGALGDITPGVDDGGFDDDGVNYATQFPGYEATPFKSTNFSGSFQLDLVGEARYFVPAAGAGTAQFVRVSQAFASSVPHFTVNGDTVGTSPSGYAIVPACTATTVGTHGHPETVLDYAGGLTDANDEHDGIYALGLRLRQGAKTSSLFYAVLGKNASLAELQAADAAANLRMNRTPGDVNCDGQVDVTDLGALATRWQQTDTSWFSADFNDDARVDIVDLGLMASNWQAGVAFSTASAQVTFVPESGGWCLLGGLPLMRRRLK